MNKRKKIWMFVLTLCLLTACVLPVYAKDIKTLYFEEHNGKMTWNNIRGSDGNWFMSFTNMVPGGEYKDQLKIENGSKKTYKLYMQAIPLSQESRKDELLEMISMKVAQNTKELYEGTASGKDYNNGNLQNVIYIGTYKPGEKGEIYVDLQLDKNVGLEYCNLLTKNDWKFMVTEVKNPETVKVIKTPKTGDISNIHQYIMIMGSALGVAILIRSKKKEK